MADHHEEHHPTGPVRGPGIVANILAIVGFVILIIIVIWGLLHIISLSSPWFSDMFSGNSKSEIVVTAPSQTPATAPFNVSWKYSSSNRGTYAIVYQCVTGLKISVDGNALPCGAAYTLGNATSSANMAATLTGTSSVQTEVSVLYIPSKAGTTGPEATGSAKIRIYSGAPATAVVEQPTEEQPAEEIPTAVVTPKPTPVVSHPTQTQAPKPVALTPADLSVRIIAVGVMDPYTGAFVARAPYSPSEISAVQFDIANRGGTTAGSYVFQAQIPTSQPYTFTSQPQAPLAPGAHVINTLRFTPAVDGTFTVSVDVYNSVRESNKSNNYASQWVTGVQNYGYPTGYQQY